MPELLSWVSTDVVSEHGALVMFTVTTARMVARLVLMARERKGRLAMAVCPVVAVKSDGVPMTSPLTLRNVTVPLQEAAVPLRALAARLVRWTRAVSEKASPKAGRLMRRVGAVVVWANEGMVNRAARMVAENTVLEKSCDIPG